MSQNELTVWHHCHLAATADPEQVILNAALVVDKKGKILWLGQEKNLPSAYLQVPFVDLDNAFITPALIDCHTHLIYGGQRADEFALRLSGASYEEVTKRGGGIVSTVQATRQASEEILFTSAVRRLEKWLQEGVAVIEVKSGYGLDLATERKMLRVARRLQAHFPIKVINTFLGAHTVPPEFQNRVQDYIDFVCQEMLPTLYQEGLIDAVDMFCETIGFSLAQSHQLLAAAQQLGLPVKMHAEQLSNMGGSALAASYQALSSDHLEYLDEAGVLAMKASGTVAVLLPGAFYFIRETQLPPIHLFRKHGVPIALATDHNPGTSPLLSMQLTLNLACTLFKMTVREALQGVTVHAAKALGIQTEYGELAVGRYADFAVWSVDSLAELAYWIARPLCSQLVIHGQTVYQQHSAQFDSISVRGMDDIFCG